MRKAVVALMAVALTVGFTATVSAEATEEDVEVSGGDVTAEDLTQDRETVNWAMIYGTVEETVSLTGDDEGVDQTVFTWDEAESAADGSAVYAFNGEDFDADNLDTVTNVEEDEVDEVPEEGADSFQNTYSDEDLSSPEVIGEDTALATSDSYDGDAEGNLFVYTLDETPVWTGLVETGNTVEENDYEVLVGEGGEELDSSYDLYVELQEP